MGPEIIKKDMKIEKVQKISWTDLQAVSFDEIIKKTEGTTISKISAHADGGPRSPSVHA